MNRRPLDLQARALTAALVLAAFRSAGAQEHRGPAGPSIVSVPVTVTELLGDADAVDAGATQIRRAVEALADKGLVSTVMTVHPQAVHVEPWTVQPMAYVSRGAVTVVLDPVESTRVLAPILDHLRGDLVVIAEDTRDELTTALLGQGGALDQIQQAQASTAASLDRLALAALVLAVMVGAAFMLAGLGVLVWLARRG